MIELNDCIYDENGNYIEWYDLYNSHGDYLGRIWNVLMLLDVRVQIREKQITGCYLLDKDGFRINIDSNGKYDWVQHAPFDQLNQLLTKLLPRFENGTWR